MPSRYVIVGNGPAGVTAAHAIRELDAAADIQIVGAERHGFYSRPGLAYYLTGQIPEGALFSRPDKELDRAHVRRTVGRVAAVDARSHRVELADGKALRYDRLLLAVGARAVRPEIEGIGLEGVVTLDNSRLYVTNFGSNSVAVYDIDMGRRIATLTVGSRPDGLALTPDQNYLLVLDTQSGDVTVIQKRKARKLEPTEYSLLTLIPVGVQPNAIVVKTFMVSKTKK